MQLTREHIVWAYRLFLGREPESEEIIHEKLAGLRSVADLRRDMVCSSEFRAGVARTAAFDATNVVIKEIGNGLRLFVDLADSHIGGNVLNGTYEPDEQEFVRSTLNDDANVIDVGANIGVFTILMASRVGREGHVYAFEPLPRNAALAERSIAENKFESRVTLSRAAVGNRPGQIELISPITTNNWGGPYLRTPGTQVPRDHETTTVPMVTLDGLQLRRPISFIKLDAEGAEALVLRGAQTLLREDRPWVLAEIHPQQLGKVSACSPDDLISEMSSYGYSCAQLLPGTPPQLSERLDRYDNDRVINAVFVPEHDKPAPRRRLWFTR